MAVGTGVKGAMNAIAASAEQAFGTRGGQSGIPLELYQWGTARGLQEVPAGALRSLRRQPSFDSQASPAGAVWWPPLPRGDVPVIVGLTLSERNGFGIRVGLVRWEKGEDPRGIGMRFEKPPEGSGRHNFPHAQLWKHIGKCDKASLLTRPDAWVPEEQPSFPLRVGSPLELLWAAAVSVYGKRDASCPFDGNDVERGKIAEYIEQLDGKK